MKRVYYITFLLISFFHYTEGQQQYQNIKGFAHNGGYRSNLHYNTIDQIFTLTVDGVSVRACGDTALIELLPKNPISGKYGLYRCVDQNCNTREYIHDLDSNTFTISPKEYGYSVKDGESNVVWYDYDYPARRTDSYNNVIFLDRDSNQISSISTNHFEYDTVNVRDPDVNNPFYISVPIHSWHVNQQEVNDIVNYSLSPEDSLFIELDFSSLTYPCTTHKKFFVAKVNENTSSTSSFKTTKVKYFPNPTSGTIYFESLPKNSSYEVYNSNGTRLKSGRYTNTGINLKKYPKGIFLIKINNQLIKVIKK